MTAQNSTGFDWPVRSVNKIWLGTCGDLADKWNVTTPDRSVPPSSSSLQRSATCTTPPQTPHPPQEPSGKREHGSNSGTQVNHFRTTTPTSYQPTISCFRKIDILRKQEAVGSHFIRFDSMIAPPTRSGHSPHSQDSIRNRGPRPPHLRADASHQRRRPPDLLRDKEALP